jgi:hypothetical protein
MEEQNPAAKRHGHGTQPHLHADSRLNGTLHALVRKRVRPTLKPITKEHHMPDRMQYDESDPRHHTIKIRETLNDVAQHAREDVAKVSDPKAQALFETTAEVIAGLAKSYDHFEQNAEPAWR